MQPPAPLPNDVHVSADILIPYMDRIRDLFRDMDGTYDRVAGVYRFNCNGCPDNCCKTRFYHHTLIETLYVGEGYRRLNPQKRRAVARRSGEVRKQWIDADRAGKRISLWCPLNWDGRCEIYPFRPMICRLHGIPHELDRPDRAIQYGPGCERFSEQCRGHRYVSFDRTPFYYRLAALDRTLRSAIEFRDKLRLTIADMIPWFEAGPERPE